MTAKRRAWLKTVSFVLLASPLLWLGLAVQGELTQPGSVLGADPGETLVFFFGELTIRMLLLGLMISTARRRLGWTWLVSVRRMVGLFAFTYVTLHLAAYLFFLAGLHWPTIFEDFTKRTYIIVGLIAFVGLIPLVITSTNGWRRRLGSRWVTLHKIVYVVVGLGLLHLFWLRKDGYGDVALYTIIYLGLLTERYVNARCKSRALSARTGDAQSLDVSA